MAYKSTFLDNQIYDVDQLNDIVASLRTGGVIFDIANSLKVVPSVPSGMSVTVSNGIGFTPNGCKLEVTEPEALTIPAPSAARSDIIVLQYNAEGGYCKPVLKTDTTEVDENFETVLAEIRLLANTTSITDAQIIDKRKASTFRGTSQLSPIYKNGNVQFKQLMVKGETVEKTIAIPLDCIKWKGSFNEDIIIELTENGLNFAYGRVCLANGGFNFAIKQELKTKSKSTSASAFGSYFGYNAASSSGNIEITDVTMTKGLISIKFYSYDNNAQLDCTINWEAI